MHEIPAKSRLLPVIPITSRAFVYRRARETDVRVTFARARAALATGARSTPDSAVGRAVGKYAGRNLGDAAPVRTDMARGATGEKRE